MHEEVVPWQGASVGLPPLLDVQVSRAAISEAVELFAGERASCGVVERV